MRKRLQLASGLMMSLLGASAVVAVALASGWSSTLSAAPALNATPAHYQYGNPMQGGAQHLQFGCWVVWEAADGFRPSAFNWIDGETPGTHSFPTGGGFYASGLGEAVLTPSGELAAVCKGKLLPSTNPPPMFHFVGDAYWGISIGGLTWNDPNRIIYRGEEHIVVTRDGTMRVVAHASRVAP